MKIAFYGNFSVDYCSEVHYAKTLRDMGHEVIELQEPRVSADRLYEIAAACDLFVWVHTHGWDTPNFDVRKVSVPTVAYHLDLYMPIERWKQYEASDYFHVDHFFTVDMQMAEWLTNNTTSTGHFLLPGVFKQECVMLEAQPAAYEVIFVGSKGYHPEWPYRPQLIDWLKQTYRDRFLHVGGDGDTGTVRGLALNQIYANAKVAVGDTLAPNFNYPYYTSDRMFESVGRGAFSVYPRIDGLDDIMLDGVHHVTYRHGDFNDLKTKIDYYLDTPHERERIRQAGFEYVKQQHTYHNRWEEILNVVNG